MSKKDKDKRKKAGGRTSAASSSSSWAGDLRRSAAVRPVDPPIASNVKDEKPLAAEASVMAAASILSPASDMSVAASVSLRSAEAEHVATTFAIPLSVIAPVPAYDLEEEDEMSSDIAPIGPTERSEPGEDAPPEAADPFEPEPKPTPDVQQLEQQIRDLESRLDEMIQGGRPDHVPPLPAPPLARPTPPSERHLAGMPSAPPSAVESSRGATAREVLSSDFYFRQWGRAGLRKRAEEVDEFGLDPAYESRYLPVLDFLYRNYFRVEAQGTENVPDAGRCLLVSNHSGGPLPYDGLMLRTTLRREHPRQRELRWLAEDFIYYLPFVGTMMNRLGAVRACQENAERLLEGENLVAVFPEGAKGIGKLFRDRYKLQRFGRGGFIRLCLRTGTPIVPTAIVGAEEANPILHRLEYMTKALGIPYLPITPTFPALGPLGLLPAPTKWKIAFGEPISFAEYGPEAADDEVLVRRLSERVRGTIQTMLESSLKARKSIWFG